MRKADAKNTSSVISFLSSGTYVSAYVWGGAVSVNIGWKWKAVY